MANINYLSLEEALEIHYATIQNSGGGEFGEIDSGRLESVLIHIQNDDYYPTFLDKITHLFFALVDFTALLMEIRELQLH